MGSQDLLRKLSDAFGVPGREGDVRRIVRDELEGVAVFSYDRTGSIICKAAAGPEAPRVMLAGHMDEVGFIVQNITKEGFVKFHTLGGWWAHTLLGQRVTIRTGKGDIPGIIGAKPVHYLTDEERGKVQKIESLFIDVGARDRGQASEDFGIAVGDPVVPAAAFAPLKDPRHVSGKALDDRMGVALVIEAMKDLAREMPPNRVYGVGTVQEEVGVRGAQTAAAAVDPDVSIVLEGAPADDTPGFSRDEGQAVLGKGPQVRLFDPTAIANRGLFDLALRTASELGIPCQPAVRSTGGTDAKMIHLHRTGVPTVVFAVPARYIHSHASVVCLDDYDRALALLTAVCRRLDAATVSALTDYRTA